MQIKHSFHHKDLSQKAESQRPSPTNLREDKNIVSGPTRVYDTNTFSSKRRLSEHPALPFSDLQAGGCFPSTRPRRYYL
ncbi:hypothetical protein TNCV_4606641 [Trichonephila clavipes]|nr:hypothetical protein TNCV_4606641 [Trichonephila clavipes]